MSHTGHHEHNGNHHHGEPTEEADIHGMLVVGEEHIFLSHFPMFGHAQHDVQAILQVHLTGDDDPQDLYVNDRKRSGERMYTVEPDPFVLTHLVTPEEGHECLCDFTGTLYRGHFERDGSVPLTRVTVTVDHIIHFRQFDPEAESLDVLHYILFGAGEERFMAHLITRPPDFDQVISVTVRSPEISDDQLRRGPVLFVPRRENDSAHRFQPGEQERFAESVDDIGLVTFDVGTELYFEEGELAERFNREQTELEKLAGF